MCIRDRSQAEAEAIMLKVHHEEKAVVGTYSYDIAKSKVEKAVSYTHLAPMTVEQSPKIVSVITRDDIHRAAALKDENNDALATLCLLYTSHTTGAGPCRGTSRRSYCPYKVCGIPG